MDKKQGNHQRRFMSVDLRSEMMTEEVKRNAEH